MNVLFHEMFKFWLDQPTTLHEHTLLVVQERIVWDAVVKELSRSVLRLSLTFRRRHYVFGLRAQQPSWCVEREVEIDSPFEI